MGCSAIVYGKYLWLCVKKIFYFILFEAAMNNFQLIVQDLVIAGADLNSATNDGETSLMIGKTCFFFNKMNKIIFNISVKLLKKVLYQ
jgi:hypothetical protein